MPSDNWSAFSDSVLSTRHLTEKDKLIRTSDQILTSANISKLYVGIAFISVSKSISQAGIYGAIVGFAYVLAVNLYCVYLLLKARNRFKNDKIVDLCDLAVKLYGEKARVWMSIILVLTNALYCICYVLFFGT